VLLRAGNIQAGPLIEKMERHLNLLAAPAGHTRQNFSTTRQGLVTRCGLLNEFINAHSNFISKFYLVFMGFVNSSDLSDEPADRKDWGGSINIELG
jgi:hypothetical protein